jgi:hypothetical protein
MVRKTEENKVNDVIGIFLMIANRDYSYRRGRVTAPSDDDCTREAYLASAP